MTKVVLIGAGRLGYQLGKAILGSKLELIQVYSRQLENAILVHPKLAINDFNDVSPNGDLYIIATPDDTIGAVVEKLSKYIPKDAFVVHVSGAKPSSILESYFKNYGSFYPLQSFSKEKEVNFKTIPICIVGNTPETESTLVNIAKQISDSTFIISDKDRLAIHVAAVFVNNFTNVLYQIGHEISTENDLDFKMLLPLIQESVDKIKDNDPKLMQTGPAKRNDQGTIDKHLEFLEDMPEYRDVYEVMTKIIRKHD